MRNQKKDGTALQQMKRSSTEIEPNEWVFNADGEFRKVRDIFDESTESSPVSFSSFSFHLYGCFMPCHPVSMSSDHHIIPRWHGLADLGQERRVVAPSPKKRRTRKGALADISVNSSRLRPSVAKQAAKKAPTKRKLTTVDLAEVAPKKRAQPPRLSLSTDVRFSPSAEEHEEFRLTMGDLGKRRKLGIFCNAEDSPGE